MKPITDTDIEHVAKGMALVRFGDWADWRALTREARNMIAAYRACEEIDHPEGSTPPVRPIDEPQLPYKVHE